MEAEIFLLPPEDGLGDMGVAYSITDSTEQVFDGFFEAPTRSGTIDDKWLTVFSMADGQGVVDYIEVHNQPQDTGPACDVDGDGICDLFDIDQLVGGIVVGSNPVAVDMGRELDRYFSDRFNSAP